MKNKRSRLQQFLKSRLSCIVPTFLSFEIGLTARGAVAIDSIAEREETEQRKKNIEKFYPCTNFMREPR